MAGQGPKTVPSSCMQADQESGGAHAWGLTWVIFMVTPPAQYLGHEPGSLAPGSWRDSAALPSSRQW